ncbi:FAD-dependent monooxygenase [Streptomyces sp. ISL-99]|uniref:FAD-dependent monooxygenase n=1 Tax=Streptomyces sp. ISL-99 TaxID=2819193 RepID=UPI001BE5F58E|nr:FAD-dependent monooxygenase [Streptomyces sp. ISL-99]MBT2529078.1 FAD-dependent monooxygenase [Streptomyces sp. ISL-99]
MSEENVPVLIVGGGIVGLPAAVFLRGHGVPVLLAERHPGPSMLAKARVLSPRTMELYRAHGLEGPLRAAPPSVFLEATDVIRASILAAPEDADGADGADVMLTDRGSGRRYSVRARYVIAADGHRSPVRRALGIRTHGKQLAHVVNIAFEADLSAALRGRPIGLGYLARPVPGTLLARLDAVDAGC